jgi:hypothetical protein
MLIHPLQIQNGAAQVTEMLLENGVSIDLQFPEDSEEDGSLLKRACLSVCPQIIKLILDRLPDSKWSDNKNPNFIAFDEEGNPSFDDQEGFELIANTLRCGLSDDTNISDVQESVSILCNFGVKPDLIGLCYTFLYPNLAETVIPFCRDELKDLTSHNPELVLAGTVGLVQTTDNGAKYFTSGPDLWFQAVNSMKVCEIDVPEGFELREVGESEDDLSLEADSFIDLILHKVEQEGADRVEALICFINKVGEDEVDLDELLQDKNETEVETLAEQFAKTLLGDLATEDEDQDDDDDGDTVVVR